MNTLAPDVRPAKIGGARAAPPVIACVGQDRLHTRHPANGRLLVKESSAMTELPSDVVSEERSPSTALTCPTQTDFDLTGLRRFTSVPDHRDIGIVALRGMVIVYDQAPLLWEGVVEGAYYVRESQRPTSCMEWGTWLRHECEEPGQVGPNSPLTIRREVVQAVRWPRADHWALRLASGFIDGPYHDWAFGRDLVGKVVGIYLPETSQRES